LKESIDSLKNIEKQIMKTKEDVDSLKSELNDLSQERTSIKRFFKTITLQALPQE
jgi:regulator of replication initiation timing